MTEILMPSLADGMEQGTIVKWLVEDGDRIEAGQELVEIETDKATMAFPAEDTGVVSIKAAEGDTLAVGEPIAVIGEPGAADDEPRVVEPEPGAPEPEPRPAPGPTAAATATTSARGKDDALATPVARRAAAAHGIDLAGLDGTGPGGRIVKGDVLTAAGLPAAPPDPSRPASPQAAPAPPEAARGGRTLQPTRLQQIVAQRMTTAKATVPHFQVQTDVTVDAALALRAQLKEVAGDSPAPSVNDIVVRACALALREHPLVNGSFVDGAYELHDEIHIGIAIATDEGLLVATVEDADVKALGQIATESRDLAARVRAGQASPGELTGATFTVSNLGMFGMTAITPVINPPQAAILGVGAARPVLARVEEEIVDRQLLTLTLSCDHRIVNGADGSRFLADVKALLETPLRLAL